jgi:hypothetical protein
MIGLGREQGKQPPARDATMTAAPTDPHGAEDPWGFDIHLALMRAQRGDQL